MSTWSTRRWKQRLWPPPVSREADPKDDYDAEEDIAVACRSQSNTSNGCKPEDREDLVLHLGQEQEAHGSW